MVRSFCWLLCLRTLHFKFVIRATAENEPYVCFKIFIRHEIFFTWLPGGGRLSILFQTTTIYSKWQKNLRALFLERFESYGEWQPWKAGEEKNLLDYAGRVYYSDALTNWATRSSWERSWKYGTTVEPLLSGPPLSGHPPLNGHTSKSQNICNTISIKYPSIKRPPPLSGRGHQWAVPNDVLYNYYLY